MTVLAWSFAATFFALWIIEHVGGAEARVELRRQVREARRG